MKIKIIIFASTISIITFLCCAMLFWIAYPLKYKEYIVCYSNQYGVSAGLVASVICAESRFDSQATSSSGACGLMQIMPATFSWVNGRLGNKYMENDIFSPCANIDVGCYYLKYLFDKYKNQVYVLACYNAGEGVVGLWGAASSFTIEQIKYLETKRYVNKVIGLIRLYNSRFD